MSVPKNAVLSLLINYIIILDPALPQESPTSRHWILPVTIGPGVVIKFRWGENHAVNNHNLWCGKVYYSNAIIIIIIIIILWTAAPNYWFKNVFSRQFFTKIS